MSKFCQYCGTPCDEGAQFCGNCGAELRTEYAEPVAAAPETPAAPAAPAAVSFATIVEKIKAYSNYILIGLAVLALVLAIVNFTGSYDVKATIKYDDYKSSNSGPISDLYESEEFALLLIGNYIYALLMLAVAAISTLGVLKAYNISNVVDNVLKGTKVCKELCISGLLGAIASVVQIVCFMLSTMEQYGMKLTVSAPWFTWLAFVIFAGIVVLDKMYLNKKN